MSATRSGLVVRAGALRCALPVESVIETMRPLPRVALPSAPPFVLGASLIRAEPTAIVDLRLLLGQPADAPPARYVALRFARAPVALAVDAVEGVRGLEEDAVGALPPLLASAAAQSVASLGVLDGSLLAVLERGVLIPDEVVRALGALELPR